MELKEFIISAVTDISEAVAEADAKVKERGGLVNPGVYIGTTGSPNMFVAPRTTLNFDVAVSAAQAGSGKAQASAKIWVIDASIGGGVDLKNESVSRLTFSVDVVLPHDKDQQARVGLVKKPS